MARLCGQAELKHARICMLGVAGYVSVDLGFRVPYAPEVRAIELQLQLMPPDARVCESCSWRAVAETPRFCRVAPLEA